MKGEERAGPCRGAGGAWGATGTGRIPGTDPRDGSPGWIPGTARPTPSQPGDRWPGRLPGAGHGGPEYLQRPGAGGETLRGKITVRGHLSSPIPRAGLASGREEKKKKNPSPCPLAHFSVPSARSQTGRTGRCRVSPGDGHGAARPVHGRRLLGRLRTRRTGGRGRTCPGQWVPGSP